MLVSVYSDSSQGLRHSPCEYQRCLKESSGYKDSNWFILTDNSKNNLNHCGLWTLPCYRQTTISPIETSQLWNLTEAQLKHIRVVRPENHRWDDNNRNPGENPLATSESSRQSHDQPALGSASAPVYLNTALLIRWSAAREPGDPLCHPLVRLLISTTTRSALDEQLVCVTASALNSKPWHWITLCKMNHCDQAH